MNNEKRRLSPTGAGRRFVLCFEEKCAILISEDAVSRTQAATPYRKVLLSARRREGDFCSFCPPEALWLKGGMSNDID